METEVYPYALAPDEILHSWVEVRLDDRWLALEGVILDHAFLRGLRAKFPSSKRAHLGHGVGTSNLKDPPVVWRGEDTLIQSTGIRQDYGVFDDPDAFYARHGENLSGIKAWLFRNLVRHMMNANVARVRNGQIARGESQIAERLRA